MNPLSKTKKLVLAMYICMLSFLLSGCWDRVEINDLAIVVGMGIDKTDNGEIELSAQIVIPQAMGGQSMGGSGQSGGGSVTVEKATGKTIYDARSKLQESVSRKLFEGHNRVVIIGKALAEDGIRKHIDFFARFPIPRLRANVFVAEGKASDVLKVIPDFERDSAEVAREIAKLKIGLNVTIKDLLRRLASESGSVALPRIVSEQEAMGKGGLRVNGSAIFKKDKMVGQIDDTVTRGVLWLRDEIELASVTLKPENAEGYISFKLLRSSTELIPEIKNGKWKMIVKITTEDDVVENETKLDMMDPKVTKRLEKQLTKKVDERIHMTLDQVQKDMEADIFGFAEAFHRKYPKQWKKAEDKWDEKFPEVEVEIKSRAYIRRPGRSTGPQGTPQDKEEKK